MRKEIRFDTALLRADRREEVTTWVRSLGVEPSDVRPEVVIAVGGHGFELHLSRFLRDDNGRIRINRAQDEVVTEPMTIDIGRHPTWPSFLGGFAS